MYVAKQGEEICFQIMETPMILSCGKSMVGYHTKPLKQGPDHV